MGRLRPYALLSLLGVACASGPDGGGVVVTVGNAADAPVVDAIAMSWRDGTGARELAASRLRIANPQADPLAVIVVQVAARAADQRVAIVRGLLAGRVVSEAAGRVSVDDRGQGELALTLRRGLLADADGDGVPDVVAHAPGTPDGDAPPTASDARAAMDAAIDQPPGAAPDAAPPAVRPDAPAPADLAPRPRALLVVGNPATLDAGDMLIQQHLVALGFEPTLRKDADADVPDTQGCAVVILSSSTVSTELGTRLRDARVPIVAMEGATFGFLGMVKNAPGSFGATTNGSIVIKTPAHPAAAGLSGTVTVANPSTALAWGAPRTTAAVVATLPQATGSPLFAFEAGAMMADIPAPARRAAFFLASSSDGDRVTDAGWRLFDALVRWAAGP